jgi:hypothetical protein
MKNIPQRKQLMISGVLFLILRLTCPAGHPADQRFELNVYGGNLSAHGGTTKVLDVYSGREIRTEIKNGIDFGARLIYQALPYLGLEVNFGSSLNKYNARLIVWRDEISTENTTYLGFFLGNLLVQPVRGRFAPFLTFGVGVFAFIDSFAPTINFGGGIKFPLSDRISFRVDIRQYYTWLKDTISSTEYVRKNFQYELTEISWPYDDKLSFFEIGAGLSFGLGRKK